MAKQPDKDMAQPKAYRPNIDPKKPQPTMNMDTRQTHYKSSKPIDFNNKVPEYKPNNYKTSFWDTPRKNIVKKEVIKKAAPPPRPAKQQQPKRPPPQQQRTTMQPLPGPNFAAKQAPPQRQQPVVHPEPEPQPKIVTPVPEPRQEHWAEPTRAVPDLAPVPAPVRREADYRKRYSRHVPREYFCPCCHLQLVRCPGCSHYSIDQTPRMENTHRMEHTPRMENTHRMQHTPRMENTHRMEHTPRMENTYRMENTHRMEHAHRVPRRPHGYPFMMPRRYY